MKRKILFIQNPGKSEALKKGIPSMVDRYKAFFRSEAGGYWSDSEFLDVDRLQPNRVTVQTDLISKLKEINAADIEYSMILFVGHGASFDRKDHFQLESGEILPIDFLTMDPNQRQIKRTVLLDACRVGYISTPNGWKLESRVFSGGYNLLGSDCRDFYDYLIESADPHVDIIKSTQYVHKAYGSENGTDFSNALIDTLMENAKVWNAAALVDRYGTLAISYKDIHSQVASKLKNQIPEFSQDKPSAPFPLYAVSRPVDRRLDFGPAEITIIKE